MYIYICVCCIVCVRTAHTGPNVANKSRYGKKYKTTAKKYYTTETTAMQIVSKISFFADFPRICVFFCCKPPLLCGMLHDTNVTYVYAYVLSALSRIAPKYCFESSTSVFNTWVNQLDKGRGREERRGTFHQSQALTSRRDGNCDLRSTFVLVYMYVYVLMLIYI